jgi:glycosyltransferase involved in cell wall biosynthesis
MQQRIQALSQEEPFDVVHVEHLRAVNYGLLTLGFELPVIWDSVDCIYLLFKRTLAQNSTLGARFKAWLDLERTRRYEKWLVSQFDRVLVTSEEDAQTMQEMIADNCYQPADLSVLPNGVNLDYFQPQATPRVPATLVYLGRMRYHANVAAVLHLVNDIMPHIWAHRPDVTLLIVGSNPPRRIQRLAANHQPMAINVTGTVPDVRPYLAQATVMVAPIRYGAGTSFKVLEAMAMNTPVVATPQAVRGLRVHPGEDVLVAEDAETFAAYVLHLLQDEDLRQELARNGRQYVERYHDWDKIAASLENVYLEVIEQWNNSRDRQELVLREFKQVECG